MRDILGEAQDALTSLPVESLKTSGVFLDRLNDNPEAARYFLTYSDWSPVTSEDIFDQIDAKTAERTQVYVDFPFCPTVCNFCAFYPVLAKDEERMASYVGSLKKEVRLLRQTYFDRGLTAGSLELGGGTPTQLPLHLLRDAVRTVLEEFPFDAEGERNSETTPEAVVGEEGLAKLKFLREAGFNRLSIGAQSFKDSVLKAANRSHTSGQTLEALDNARGVGFERINFDLLLGLMDQTVGDFIESVERCLELDIDIIEIYSMRYFDTKKPVPLTQKFLAQPARFMKESDILVARVAAHLLLTEAGYASSNGRTYYRPSQGYYSEYYRENFLGSNVLGVGRKSHSNVYPWQYANYRNIDKYSAALDNDILPIAAGHRMSSRGLLAKHLTGALQLAEPIHYDAIRENVSEWEAKPFDDLMKGFAEHGLLTGGAGGVYEKTFFGFLFVEEMLKSVYDAAVTPFSINTDFLGKKQVNQFRLRS
jgi:oxygen-independent coproporphyrinogen-3 oxidase